MTATITGQSGQPIRFLTKPNVNGDDVALMANVGPVTNFDSATGTVIIPSGLEIGTRRLIRKIHPTQGTVTIECTGETFTRAGLASVELNADGDYWLLEKVTATRWELVDGWNTGENANGRWIKRANGKIEISNSNVASLMTDIAANNIFRSTGYTWSYPIGLIENAGASAYCNTLITASLRWVSVNGVGDNSLNINMFSATSSTALISVGVGVLARWYV